jgi:hypothetical protein
MNAFWVPIGSPACSAHLTHEVNRAWELSHAFRSVSQHSVSIREIESQRVVGELGGLAPSRLAFEWDGFGSSIAKRTRLNGTLSRRCFTYD